MERRGQNNRQLIFGNQLKMEITGLKKTTGLFCRYAQAKTTDVFNQMVEDVLVQWQKGKLAAALNDKTTQPPDKIQVTFRATIVIAKPFMIKSAVAAAEPMTTGYDGKQYTKSDPKNGAEWGGRVLKNSKYGPPLIAGIKNSFSIPNKKAVEEYFKNNPEVSELLATSSTKFESVKPTE